MPKKILLVDDSSTVLMMEQMILAQGRYVLRTARESMKDPGLYWRTNVGGALNLLEACAAAGVKNFVFSSI